MPAAGTTPPRPPPRRRRRGGLWLAALLVAIGLAPAVPAVVAALVAERHGCTLHEGFVNPCVIGGTDWGATLYAMGMMPWLMLVTLPLALVGLVLAAGLLLAALFRRRS